MPLSITDSPSAFPVRHRLIRRHLLLVLLALAIATTPLHAQQEWFVAAGATGTGSASAPFGTIKAAVQAAQPGDTVTVRPGTYAEMVTSVRGGAPDAAITLRAANGRGSVVVTRAGRVLEIAHPHIVIDGLVFDGQYAATDAVRLSTGAHHFVLRNAEVRRSGRDCIDMGAPSDVLIEHSSINHCLWWKSGRQDAHAIVAGAVRRLTLRHLDIHTFSGDGLQLDPDRTLPGWGDVAIEHTRFRLAPLPAAQNGFPAGVVPGENAVDTKAHPSAPRATLTITDTTAEGFGPGLIANMAAFNLKEHVDVRMDRVAVSRSEIAFRLRGPGENGGAWVHLDNVVVHNVLTGIRYEGDIEKVQVTHATFGRNVSRALRAASSGWSGVDVQHSLFLGTSLPTEAPASAGNLAAATGWFAGAAADDYRLLSTAPAVDAVKGTPAVPTDHIGTPRPQGAAADVGAYEYQAPITPTLLPAKPSSLRATALLAGTSASVALRWTDRSKVEERYEVLRSSGGGPYVRVALLPANSTAFTDTTTARQTTYRYRVRGLNQAGVGAADSVTVTTK